MTDPFARWEAALRENERTMEAIKEACDSIEAALAAQAEALRTIRDRLMQKEAA
ncbi:MAG: hypothetical protein GX567_19815 [Clostridia bacterium]|nr:hypothetical protein [Clostridia bacterium]